MGFSFKRMFKHPFGSHSLFHTVTHNPLVGIVAGAVVPPLGIVSAVTRAKALVSGGEALLRGLHGAPVGMPSVQLAADMPRAMPGGASGKTGASHNAVKHRRRGSARTASRGRSVRRGVRRR